jgi:uncharacterized membrane protein
MVDTPHTTATYAPQAAPAFSPIVAGLVIALAAAIIGAWLLLTPAGLLGKADAVGYAVCHRIPARTFHIHDRPLPLCARCTGIYLGVLTALGNYAARGRLRAARWPQVRFAAVMLLAAATIALDGFNSYFSLFEAYTPLYPPHNTLRLITGTAAGLALFTIILPVFNATVWYDPPRHAPVQRWRDLGVLFGTAAAGIGLVLLDLAAVRYVVGLLTSAGVVMMFGIIGTVLFLTVTRRENTLVTWRDLALPALAGLTFAITVIGVIDAARYSFTGTWDGFDLFE